jgi:hypothetical protein
MQVERLSNLILRISNSYSTAYVVVAAVLYFLSLLIPDTHVATATEKLPEAAKLSMNYLLEMTKFTGTLLTTSFGACAALAIKGREWSTRWERLDGLLIVAAFLAGASGFYGLYLGHIEVLEMIHAGVFDLFQVRLDIAMKIQYYGLLIEIFLVGLVFTRMLDQRKDAAGPKSL